MSSAPKSGSIGWVDLTVPDASGLRDFYCSVTGWNSDNVDMGGYADFNMLDADGNPVAGVCHARGGNADMPPCWLIYIVVEDIDKSVEACENGGGEIIAGPKSMGAARYCVIRDPAGAVCALYQP